MADIEVVIKIPEELKRAIDNNEEYRLYTESVGHVMLTAIKNGTPLPEHHGDLIDRKKLLDNTVYAPSYAVRSRIYNADTIIPATKEGAE